LVFLCKYKHHILDFFVCFEYIGLDLNLRKSVFKKTPINIGELQHMKYICNEIILITEYENCIHISKLRLWVEFFVEIFVVTIIDIHQLNLGPFGSLKFLVENSLKMCGFFFQQ